MFTFPDPSDPHAHPTAFWLAVVPLLAAMTVAAVVDVRRRKIPNWITFSLILSGFATAAAGFGLTTQAGAGVGFGVGFAIGLMLYLAGATGAGDVKLLAATGVWLGPVGVGVVFATAAVVGLVIVLAQAARAGKLAALLRNTGVLAASAVHVRRLGREQAQTNARRFTSIDRPLPYAVPVLAATVIVLVADRHGVWSAELPLFTTVTGR